MGRFSRNSWHLANFAISHQPYSVVDNVIGRKHEPVHQMSRVN
jgi:hypothetical protein